MAGRRALGRPFGWLWSAFAVSTMGTWLAFDALPLIAIRVLHVGPAAVSLLAAAGPAVAVVVAIPLGPWVEFRRKRPVMIGMDLIRFAAVLSIPVAFAVGRLGFLQLLAVSVVVGAADLTFTAASGAYLKSVVRREDLLIANGRFESTTWTATVLGPPLGGALIGLVGPVTTVLANGVSFLLSALGIRAIADPEPAPQPRFERLRPSDVLEGWRAILRHSTLKALLFNAMLVNGLIMASAPLLAVLMLGRLGFAPWQYGLAFAVPCLGGLVGSRLAQRLVERYGRHRILRCFGATRAIWPVGLVFVQPGVTGLVIVIAVEFGLIFSAGVFNPVLATVRLELAPADRVVRVLSAWSISTRASIAILVALWGGLAALIGARAAIGAAGVLLLATPLLLPRREFDRETQAEIERAA